MHSPLCIPLYFVSITSSYQLLSTEVTNYFHMEQLICPIKVFCFLPFPSSKHGTYGIQTDFIGSSVIPVILRLALDYRGGCVPQHRNVEHNDAERRIFSARAGPFKIPQRKRS